MLKQNKSVICQYLGQQRKKFHSKALIIGRIQKDKIKFFPGLSKKRLGAVHHDIRFSGKTGRREVAPDNLNRCTRLVDKSRLSCASGDCLNSHLSTAGKDICYIRSRQTEMNHAENRFLDDFGSWTDIQSFQRFQFSSTCGTGNNSHIFPFHDTIEDKPASIKNPHRS